MKMKISTLLPLLLVLLEESDGLSLRCPSTITKDSPFNVTSPTVVTIEKTSGLGWLCTLTLELSNGLFIPIARSYDGNDWERAGGTFAARLQEWVCNGNTCTSTLPIGDKYVLQTRSTSSSLAFEAEVARFLEAASYGAKPSDLSTWGGKTFAQYIKDQATLPITSHRETFRTLANPRWTFHKPEFAANLNPCAPKSTWRRQILTSNDRNKKVNVRKVNDRWEIKVDNHVRAMVSQLRFINAQRDFVEDGGSYDFCASEEEIRRGIYRLRLPGGCRSLVASDLIVDFPDGFTPPNSIDGLIPALQGNTQWKSTSSRNPEYMYMDTITPKLTVQSDQSSTKALRTNIGTTRVSGGFFCRRFIKLIFGGLFCRKSPSPPIPVTPQSPTTPSVPTPVTTPSAPTPITSSAPTPVSPPTPTTPSAPTLSSSTCKIASLATGINTPLFAKTMDGIWLLHDPRISIRKNTLNDPILDGGLEMLQSKQTYYCANVPRSLFNEATCIISAVPACKPGSTNASEALAGTIVCGSAGEVGNDVSLGDNWLDISSIDSNRAAIIGLPVDRSSSEGLGRQREFVWNEVSLNASDQLRQRIAFALLYIFSLPKISIRGEFQSTEIFLVYYDIFVRNAFGNYGDILREISYNPLNVESLSYIDSRSVAHASTSTNTIYPDENYARELMQLFTIGLFELNLDGTPVYDSNGIVQTYDSDDVLSFAKVWTAFRRNSKRANVEAVEGNNRYDPMRIEADRRDRFPKTDLASGYIGDFYPLCIDLPARSFLRIGAKYRLIGSSPLPDLKRLGWPVSLKTQFLSLQNGSALYTKLCKPSQSGLCSYPSVVTLDTNLICQGVECNIDIVHVLQIGSVYYEYVRVPCIEQPFFNDGVRISGWSSRYESPVCTHPNLPVANEACCLQNITQPWSGFATQNCLISGEQMTRDTARIRCAAIGMGLCDYVNVTGEESCPSTGFHWTSDNCRMLVKISADGQAAIVHEQTNYGGTLPYLRNNTPSYFKVYWENDQYPTISNACGGGQCNAYLDTCLCNVTVSNDAVFSSPPNGADEILKSLRIGHPDPFIFDVNSFITLPHSDYKSYSKKAGTCCDSDTFFEVTDRNGFTKYLRNLKSTVSIAGTSFKFRNPPQFNSVLITEYSIADAQHETEAALNHLLYHPNTPPFVAYRFIQRFGVSNPTPRYTSSVATAFRSGRYTNDGLTFGKGKYGDMEATIAAVLLDREARSFVLDKDPAQGSLREPILKVLSFMRATNFKSSVPLVELDYMEQRVGQMAYEQSSVFSFFRPEYSPSELSGTGLTSPESQTMSTSNIVGLLNGLFSLIKNGLSECNGGFGAYGDCSSTTPSGNLTYVPSNINAPADMVQDLSYLMTGGRMSLAKQQSIVTEINGQPNATAAYKIALQLIASTPEFHSTSTTDLLAPAEKPPKIPTETVPPTPGYKAVVHFFLRGGCDSFNVLVPGTSCGGLHNEYVSVRGRVGLSPSQTLPLAGNAGGTQSCDSFTVHNKLSTIQNMYNDGDLLFLANTGVLTRYVNRSDYSFRTKTPLFSHNSMQDEVARLDPLQRIGGTGALGRLADVLQAKNYMTGRIAIDSPSSNLASRSATTPPIITMSQRGVSLFNQGASSSTMNNTIQQLNNGVSGIYGDLWSTLLKRSINQTDELFTLLRNNTPTTTFPSTGLGNRFKVAAQLIKGRVARGVHRDIFFIPFDGFDTHNDVSETLVTRFDELNPSLKAFVDEMKELGLWDNIVIVQTSDFGRTMTGNSGGGTDHGWGGNYWLAGGGVKGKRIVGKYPPTFSLDYEYNIDRGRLIPTTSWDSVFNSISEWMGVTTLEEYLAVLPNRNNFPDVFPSSELFN